MARGSYEYESRAVTREADATIGHLTDSDSITVVGNVKASKWEEGRAEATAEVTAVIFCYLMADEHAHHAGTANKTRSMLWILQGMNH
eukprot:5837199-Pleurochrysis_carterae.AAC.1